MSQAARDLALRAVAGRPERERHRVMWLKTVPGLLHVSVISTTVVRETSQAEHHVVRVIPMGDVNGVDRLALLLDHYEDWLADARQARFLALVDRDGHLLRHGHPVLATDDGFEGVIAERWMGGAGWSHEVYDVLGPRRGDTAEMRLVWGDRLRPTGAPPAPRPFTAHERLRLLALLPELAPDLGGELTAEIDGAVRRSFNREQA